MADKKTSLVYILDVLKKYSDENNPLTQEKIIEYLENDYGLTLERKAVGRAIKTLSDDCGYLIEEIKRKGYYLAERLFESNEVRYLIDAIFSSHAISGNYAADLANKILDTQSEREKRKYSYIKKSKSVTRIINPDFFENITKINQAIDENKKISFTYMHYDEHGRLCPRSNDQSTSISPYYLVNSRGNYYLLCSFDDKKLRNYRLEYVKDVKILEDTFRIPERDIDGLGETFKIDDYLNKHIYMFNDKPINAKLRIDDINVITSIHDTFGENASIEETKGWLIATIESDKKSLFYWCLQYGDCITILDPKPFKEEMFMFLKKTLRKYKEFDEFIGYIPSKPKIYKIIKDELNNIVHQNPISKLLDYDFIKELRIRLYDNSMPNYKTENFNKMPNIIITNDNDSDEKYAIGFIKDFDDATDEKYFNLLRNIKYLENIKYNEKYSNCYAVFFTNNSSYNHDNINDCKFFELFKRKTELEIESNKEYQYNGETLKFFQNYKIKWDSFKNPIDGFYSAYIIEI